MTLFDFDPVERLVVGTVGPPGQRAFFLQARAGHRLVSVSLEKGQVAALGERLAKLVAAAGSEGEAPVDNGPLDAPIEDQFRVSALGLAWDSRRGRVIILCHDHDPEDEAGATTGTTLRVVLTPSQVREFSRRAASLVAAGRPPCPFCGQPLDPAGHLCPRANGYRR